MKDSKCTPHITYLITIVDCRLCSTSMTKAKKKGILTPHLNLHLIPRLVRRSPVLVRCQKGETSLPAHPSSLLPPHLLYTRLVPSPSISVLSDACHTMRTFCMQIFIHVKSFKKEISWNVKLCK